MIPYWILFSVFAIGSLVNPPQIDRRWTWISAPSIWPFGLAAFLTSLMIGLRFDVGGDWINYIAIFDEVRYLNLADAISFRADIGYSFLNWLAAQLGITVWFVNLICGFIVMVGVGRLCWRQPNPWLAVLVAVPYFIIVVAMGYTRQAAAIGIICFGLSDPRRNSIVRMLVYILLAALMHKTAVLALPIILVPLMRRNLLAGVVGVLGFAAIYYLVLRSTADLLLTNYVVAEYSSQGAVPRVMMNVVAGVFALALRHRLGFDSFDKNYWTTSAILSCACLIGLLVTSSTAVDRLALFLIPLQIVIFSRLPYVGSRDGTASQSVLAGVIAYSAIVQFVWLVYADNADSWLPYLTIFNEPD